MEKPNPAARGFLPWLVLGPAFTLAGVALGVWSQRASREASAAAAPPVVASGVERVVGMPSLAPIVERVRQGVVAVHTMHVLGGEAPLPDVSMTSDRSLGVSRGTGFVLHRDGLILTALHLVAQPTMIMVDIPGCGRREAEIVGEDPSTDLAVLRLCDPPDDLYLPELAESESVHQGDWVVTLGNPLSFMQSVSVGVVSYVGRHLLQDGVGVTNDYLQFTAPANPGSSGSPVFDMTGRVVGITTRAAIDGEGLSFAVPTRVINKVLDSMERNGGHVRRAYLGISFLPVDRYESRRQSLRSGRGVRIFQVVPDQPADLAGLCEGDIIVRYDGRDVENVLDLHDWITWSAPRKSVVLEVVRDGEHLDPLLVTLGELGDATRALTH